MGNWVGFCVHCRCRIGRAAEVQSLQGGVSKWAYHSMTSGNHYCRTDQGRTALFDEHGAELHHSPYMPDLTDPKDVLAWLKT